MASQNLLDARGIAERSYSQYPEDILGVPEPAGEPYSREQVEAITRIVRAVLAEEEQSARANRGLLLRWLDAAKAYWPLLVALVPVGLALAAWWLLGVSPLESAREVRERMLQHDHQQELSRRHIELGNDFLNVGQPKAAEAEFTHAKELDRYNPDADLGLLKVSVFEMVVEKGYDPEVAQRRIKSILDLKGEQKQKPRDTHALAFMGDVYSSINCKQALHFYDEAIASDSRNAWAYYGKGILAEERGDRDTALKMYDAASNISPWNQTFLNNAAYQYYLTRDYKQAEELYVRLLNLQPDFLLSYSMLGNAELMLGDAAQADHNLEPLEAMLQGESIAKLKGNQGSWEFEVQGQPNPGPAAGDACPAFPGVILYSPQEKTTYLRYVLALARQLAGYPQEARRELQEAAAESHGHDTSQARHVLVSDISNLESARPEYAKPLHEFRVALDAK